MGYRLLFFSSLWTKATEIHYSRPVVGVVCFHSYLIERKRPTQMIFSNTSHWTVWYRRCKRTAIDLKVKRIKKKHRNVPGPFSWVTVLYAFTFRLKSFRSLNITKRYINFLKLNTQISKHRECCCVEWSRRIFQRNIKGKVQICEKCLLDAIRSSVFVAM